MTKVISKKQLNEAIVALKQGKIVAFPTETVYGLGVVYNNKQALNNLFLAKDRPENKSVTLMVYSKEEIEKYAIVSKEAKCIIDQFMPGKLTMIFKKQDYIDKEMTCGKETIGIRIPDHPLVLALLKEVGPMLVTSANLSNHPNTTNTHEVLAQLDGRIDVVVDGSTSSTIASTVVDVSNNEINILREGQITLEELEGVII